jgi:hypothetical protein
VPRDEALEKRKKDAFNLGKLKGILRNIIPSLTVTDSDYLKGFSDLNSIYKGRSQEGGDQKKRSFQNIVSRAQDSVEEFFKFDPPHIISSKHHFINNCFVFEPSPLTGSFGHLQALTTLIVVNLVWFQGIHLAGYEMMNLAVKRFQGLTL